MRHRQRIPAYAVGLWTGLALVLAARLAVPLHHTCDRIPAGGEARSGNPAGGVFAAVFSAADHSAADPRSDGHDCLACAAAHHHSLPATASSAAIAFPSPPAARSAATKASAFRPAALRAHPPRAPPSMPSVV